MYCIVFCLAYISYEESASSTWGHFGPVFDDVST